GAAAKLTAVEVERVWADIAAKRRATRHLRLGPQLVRPVEEIAS
ncbi:NAD(+) synthase, partial [Mesorhizobium sp. M7A.F.Ca.AU.002.06.1.1]